MGKFLRLYLRCHTALRSQAEVRWDTLDCQ